MDNWDRGYRKIAALQELRESEPKLFRTGGAIVLLFRTGNSVAAADATNCVSENRDASSRERLKEVAECLGAEVGLNTSWRELVEQKPLPVEVRDGDIWVCVDQCGAA
jgi:nitrite reductase/ring-hydroxylating ferredoxin subunit